MTNCKNCGAPLIFHYCEYCGTDYSCTYGDPGLDGINTALQAANKLPASTHYEDVDIGSISRLLKAGVISVSSIKAGIIEI